MPSQATPSASASNCCVTGSLFGSPEKISSALARLTLRVLMTVDAREKQVSLVSEFPLRSSNGALNGSLTRLNQGLDESMEC